MKLTDLKKQLGEMDKFELIELICKLHKSSKEVKVMLDVEFGGGEAEDKLFDESKEKIKKEFDIRRLSLRNAKKVISDFKKVSKDKVKIAELLLYYVECGIEFLEDYGDAYEAFYTSIENTFASFVKEVNKLPDDRYYWEVSDRITSILRSASHMGYALGDSLEDISDDIIWQKKDF